MVGGGDTRNNVCQTLQKTDTLEKCASRSLREAYCLENVIKTIGASLIVQLTSLVGSRYRSEIMFPTNGSNNMSDLKMQMTYVFMKIVLTHWGNVASV